MTQYIFFSGKGGVGKTTMAAATALYHAGRGSRTLIVTTDPASNLADVFEQKIGHQVTQINGVENLYGMEIEPDAATREYRERIIAPFRAFMPKDVIAALEEQFNSPCTTEIASFDRFVDFMNSEEYDVVVFDTAPTGHTIRLLELPVDWSRHIEEAAKGGGHTCIGPVQAIQQSKAKYDRATALLKNRDKTSFIFVMRPEELSLYETRRAAHELASIGVEPREVIINGILPAEVCTIDFFRARYKAQQEVIKAAEEILHGQMRHMLLRAGEVKGLHGLRSVAGELFDGVTDSTETTYTGTEQGAYLPEPDLKSLLIPSQGIKRIFFTGKGGVGKTTISCTTALYLARQGYRTLLVTTDPAGHIGEVLGRRIGSEPTPVTDSLDAVMIDQQQAFVEYKEKVLRETKERYSEDMLAAVEEELNSPCTQEMAAFEQFAKYIRGTAYQAVIFDTAPTGHTLRLLNLPFDYAKQVEMMVSVSAESVKAKAESEERYDNIIGILRDPEQSVFCLVLYPEATPIVESYRAKQDLENAGIKTQLVVANMLLPEEVCTNSFFRSRRRMQLKYLRELPAKFGTPVLTYPLLAKEVKGLDSLTEAIKYLR